MFKNKFILWGGLATFIAVVAATAGWFFVVRGDSLDHQQTSLVQATEDAAANASAATSNQPVTLSSPAPSGGPQLSANSSPTSNQGATDSNASEVAKLLDPKTFTQYDKYKSAQSASFIDLQTGTGAAVTGGSQVSVLYRGWLTNGTVFDESKTGSDGKIQAFGFVEGQHKVIPGWESALEGIKDGGVRLLIIPPAQGYGGAGQGPIPGDSVLIFQVQVVQVK